jgi:hypothetical protein
MKLFTFFLKNEEIHEISAEDKNAAFRQLCAKLGQSWGFLYGELLNCFEKDPEKQIK